jgi:hypothetical protein
MSEEVNNQYDFFKLVNLSANGAIGVNVISGGTGGGGGVTNTVVGSNGITNVGTNTNADLSPTYGVLANTFCEGNDVRLTDSFVTASTLNVNTLELARNNGLPTLTTDLSSLAGGEINTASNVGGGNNVFDQKVGTDLQFRTIVAGTNVTITSGATTLTVNSSGGGGGTFTGGTVTGPTTFESTVDIQDEFTYSYEAPTEDGFFMVATGTTGLMRWAKPRNFDSTQWSSTAASVPLANGQAANGMTFFTADDKLSGGTTSWNGYNIAYGIDLTLNGTSGTANINLLGTDYLATFDTNLATTAENWVTTNKTALNAVNIRPLYAAGTDYIRFCSSEAKLTGLTITNVSGDLDGTTLNPFTGVDAPAPDHILVPYVGKPYEGMRLRHQFRVNFGIETGTIQTLALSLRRFEDDSIIGSNIKIQRDPDVEGNQIVFVTYTGGANDPFVTGGFYFSLQNDSGTGVNINGNVGIYITTDYETPVIYPGTY